MKQEFAVVLLDVKMPGMDGFETAALIHDHPRFETIPIIFVTGVHVTEFDRLKGYKAGAIDYVYIPVVPEILRSKVAVLVELYRKRRELQGVNRELADSNKRLAEANYTLQTEKTRELEAVNGHLQRANDELSRTNLSLETEIRERQRAEDSLKEAVTKRDEFLAMLSHELRNPLSPLRNAAHLLMQGETQDPKIVWSRGVIARQLKHMTRLVDDLLDVSRIARGKIVLVSEPVDIADVVAAAVETVQPLLEQKKQDLRIELANPGSPCAAIPCGSRRWSATCCTTPPSTRARAGRSCSPRASTVSAPKSSIRDSGVGIPAESMPHIFELFTQVPGERAIEQRRPRHRARAGTRAGGAAWRRDRRQQRRRGPGQRIHRAAAADGAGSRRGRRSVPAVMRSPRPTATVRRNILIADDNQDALESLALMLRMEGHEVYCASDGEEALALAGQRRPEIVVLDVGMPKLDGCEVARRIRAESWGRGAILVALTGWGQDVDRVRSREAGFDMHLVKPVDPAMLCDMLVTH